MKKLNKNNRLLLKQKTLFILDNLDVRDRNDFVFDLINAISENRDVEEIINEWKLTAEINANPKRKAKILTRMKTIEVLING